MSSREVTPRELAATALRSSWRDALAARYELDQARLRVEIDDSSEPEEYL